MSVQKSNIYYVDVIRDNICILLNMSRGTSHKIVEYHFSIMYDCVPYMAIAIAFYTRNVRGRGERSLSYTMMKWLLKNHEDRFMDNYDEFINMGCYRDCLAMADDKCLNRDQIKILLAPMATQLGKDHELYVMNGGVGMSLASKWAPREGKTFSHLIPYLKQLCGISGSQSSMLWRRYITMLSRGIPPTTERLLSSNKYEDINFQLIPHNALKLYNKKFTRTPELSCKFKQYMTWTNRENQTKIISTINPIRNFGLVY